MNLSLFSLLFLAVCLAVTTSATSADTSTYFGGSETEDYVSFADGLSSDKYPASQFFPSLSDATLGAALHWGIDEEAGTIHVALAVRATGWVGFGISENGGMMGSDVVLYETANPDELKDAHILDSRIPQEDECQDWTMDEVSVTDSFILLQATRKLDTEDSQDLPIINDVHSDVPSHRIIFAWGDEDTVTAHSPVNRISTSIRFYRFGQDVNDFFQSQVSTQASGYFEIRSRDYPIKPIDTEYVDVCITADEILAQTNRTTLEGMTIIGFETIVDPRATPHIHHLVVNGAEPTYNGVVSCAEFDRQGQETLLAWAVGGEPFLFPENVGVSIGEKGFSSFNMILHYDNPSLIEGVLDSSGVRIYYTEVDREHEMGMMKLGDPLFDLSRGGETVGIGLTEHTFECPGSCTAALLNEPITVFRHNVHMHARGISSYTDLLTPAPAVSLRSGNDTELPINKHSSTLNFFDFDMQGFMAIQQDPYVVNPGDSFRTVCFYETTGTDRSFGFSAKQEMCLIALMYYPRQKGFEHCGRNFPMAACAATYSNRTLEGIEETGREFGSKADGDQCQGGKENDPTSSKDMNGIGAVSVVAAVVSFWLSSF